jgi:multisubunit Na+/H+ antiporter MnhG subunit
MGHDVSLALVALGTVVIVASCLLAVAVRSGVFDRIHFLTPVTSLGCPLVAVGLCIEQGWGLIAASYLLAAGLLFFTGPFLEAAVGRLAGQVEGRIRESGPE